MRLFASKAIEQRWEERLQRPFWKLVQLFSERIFRGGGDSDTEGMDLGVGLVLTFLALPGGFVSVLLFDKYGSLLQWLRGQLHVDTLLIALPDEYFFIALSMTVTGMVAVWRWDAIFPDRRDYMNLAHLPISSRTIFGANLLAMLFLIALVAIDVNGASCVLFPMVVSAAQGSLPFFLKFGLIHAAGVLLASVFAFFAVFSLLGLLMSVLPPRLFRVASSYARGVVVISLVTTLCTSFAVPDLLWKTPGRAPAWAVLMPSCWFVSLCQLLRGRANPAMVELAWLAIPGLVGVMLLALATYAIGYRRHFARIAETGEAAGVLHKRSRWTLGFLEPYLLPTAFLRGCFRFVGKTLVRSEAHRLVLTGISGLALVLSSQALMNAFQGGASVEKAAMTPDALSIPFIVTFLLVVALRVVFEIPAEIHANWIFQLMLDAKGQEIQALARRVIALVVLPWILASTFALYVYFEGIVVACLHTLLVGCWAVLLMNIVLLRFRKLPFTCSLPVFKQHSIIILISFCFGFLIYAVSTPDFEASALPHPLKFISLVPVALVAWFVPHYLAKSTAEFDRRLIFEESAARGFERLGLSE